jgi:exodeoxyribonuclease VII large subunit
MSTPLFDFESKVEEKVAAKVTTKVARREKVEEKVQVQVEEQVEVVGQTEPETIGLLTRRIKGVIEGGFSNIWVVGEVSNLSRPQSGHIFLTLKDKSASLPAVMWRSLAVKLKFDIADGMELVCRGQLDVYPPQGRYQAILTKVEPKGIGALELAFRQLHQRLLRQGLFDPMRKKPLPPRVRNVALITSATGAAVRDFLQVLRRRTKQVNVLLVPVRVQGDGAANEIANAIRVVHEVANERQIDCIVVTRGGGSVEDLWAFNEEVLVKAVAGSRIPVVSGVGHEIDITLCDLAADVRALTPSEAAERIAPKDSEIKEQLDQLKYRVDQLIDRKLYRHRNRLDYLSKHQVILRPERIVEMRTRSLERLTTRLKEALDRKTTKIKQRIERNAAALEALSPLAIIARGYSLTESADGKRIKSIKDVKQNDTIKTRLKDGYIESNTQATYEITK